MSKRIELPPVRNAYAGGKEAAPLVGASARRDTEYRSVRSQRKLSGVQNAFAEFFKIASRARFDTQYDLHRQSVYKGQASRISSKYRGFIDECTSVLDLGCGTGKLMRKIADSPARMEALVSGELRMRMLGLDCSMPGLQAATLKRDLMMSETPGLGESLSMELLYMDLLDLDSLDLRRTCIGDGRVDLVLASDIFYWMPAEEREWLLAAIKHKLKDTGYLLTFEFSEAWLRPSSHLSRKMAKLLFQLSRDPEDERELRAEGRRDLERLKRMIEAAGFRYLPELDENESQGLKAPFPPMVSRIFKPR